MVRVSDVSGHCSKIDFVLFNKLKNKKILKMMFYPFVYIFHIIYLTCFINSKRIDIARGRMPYLMSYAL